MRFLTFASLGALLFQTVAAYEVPISETDVAREVCSGMWAGSNTYINVTFSKESYGRLALIIYEFGDIEYIGKITDPQDEVAPRTWVCTSDALQAGLCQPDDLGKFIISLPGGTSISDTTIWNGSVEFSNGTSVQGPGSSDFWHPPDGLPDVPSKGENGPTNWRRQLSAPTVSYDISTQNPIHYRVLKKGYYCIGTVPVTYQSNDATIHGKFSGDVLFQNVFHGQLPASEYPKIRLYLAMTALYLLSAGAWGFLCYKHKDDILPIQIYISSLFGFLVIEMLANWTYYRYINAHGDGAGSIAFLVVVAILAAGRNALSFFLLLVVSLGLSVVREEIPTMNRCKALAIAHFIFGVMYAIAVVEIELEAFSITSLFFFVMPLSFTLTTFLLWIMYGLQGTIAELRERKQSYKLGMFRKLHYILIAAVVVIGAFFVITSMMFSNRYEEDFAAQTWQYRWWLMDGYLSILFLFAFDGIAYLWRPTGNNRRLAMSTELAQDEDEADSRDAEEYDLEALERHEGAVGNGHNASGPRQELGEDNVVFEIGDEDEEGESTPKGRKAANGGYEVGEDHEDVDESKGLIGNGNRARIDKRLD